MLWCLHTDRDRVRHRDRCMKLCKSVHTDREPLTIEFHGVGIGFWVGLDQCEWTIRLWSSATNCPTLLCIIIPQWMISPSNGSYSTSTGHYRTFLTVLSMILMKTQSARCKWLFGLTVNVANGPPCTHHPGVRHHLSDRHLDLESEDRHDGVVRDRLRVHRQHFTCIKQSVVIKKACKYNVHLHWRSVHTNTRHSNFNIVPVMTASEWILEIMRVVTHQTR